MHEKGEHAKGSLIHANTGSILPSSTVGDSHREPDARQRAWNSDQRPPVMRSSVRSRSSKVTNLNTPSKGSNT